MRLNYPYPGQDFYLVYKIDKVLDPEFINVRGQFRKLQSFVGGGTQFGLPFTVSLAELMRVGVR